MQVHRLTFHFPPPSVCMKASWCSGVVLVVVVSSRCARTCRVLVLVVCFGCAHDCVLALCLCLSCDRVVLVPLVCSYYVCVCHLFALCSHTRTHAHMHLPTYLPTYTHTHTHTHTQAHTPHTPTHTHTHTQAHCKHH